MAELRKYGNTAVREAAEGVVARLTTRLLADARKAVVSGQTADQLRLVSMIVKAASVVEPKQTEVFLTYLSLVP